MEIWKDIKEFPGYQVSNEGRVRSFYKSRGYGGGGYYDKNNNPTVLHPTRIGKQEHLRVFPYKDGKRSAVLVHRLVAEEFIPNPNNYSVVRHLDDNPTNNNVDNLAWGTQKDNVQDSIRNGRQRHDGLVKYNDRRKTPVIAIHTITCDEEVFESQNEASRLLGINQYKIWDALKTGKTIKGWAFKYVDGGDY